MELLQVDIDEMKARSKSSDLLWKMDLQMR